jgi:hypothetical protein
MGAPVSHSRELLSRNSFDCLDSYGLQTVALEVFLQRTNHLFKEFMEGADLCIADAAPLFVDRDLAPHDAAAEGAEGETKVFSQKFIGNVARTAARPPQGLGGQTSRSCNIKRCGPPRFGFEMDAPSSANIL